MILLAILSLALQPAPPPAWSTSLGYGTCEDWTRSRYYPGGTRRTDERARRMEQWVWGYVAAFERYGHPRRNERVAVLNSILDQLDAYCTAHQQTMFGDAVNLLVEQLRRRPSRQR